jgi:UDP-N-acetylmuramoylalanine-D-glutamate ligase
MMQQSLSLNGPLTKRVWKNRRVLILGLGQYPQGSGVSAALLFARLGAHVTVTDLQTAKALGDLNMFALC